MSRSMSTAFRQINNLPNKSTIILPQIGGDENG
jgi:hypothetical protein